MVSKQIAACFCVAQHSYLDFKLFVIFHLISHVMACSPRSIMSSATIWVLQLPLIALDVQHHPCNLWLRVIIRGCKIHIREMPIYLRIHQYGITDELQDNNSYYVKLNRLATIDSSRPISQSCQEEMIVSAHFMRGFTQGHLCLVLIWPIELTDVLLLDCYALR